MIRSFFTRAVPGAAALLPPVALQALCGRGVLLPYYHLVTDEPSPHVRHLYRFCGIGEFRKHLDFLLSHYIPVGLADLVDSLQGVRPLPERAFLLSFDDGFREMAEVVAPILREKGVPAVFFLNSAFVDNRELCFHQKISLVTDAVANASGGSLRHSIAMELNRAGIPAGRDIARLRAISYGKRSILERLGELAGVDFDLFLRERKPYLQSTQIQRLLDDGFSIGAHSVDHPLYRDISLEEQLRQTRDSMKFLIDRFALGNRAFAFPHSDTGVAGAFFEEMFRDGTVEITFGTAGCVRDSWPGHFQRFSMEKVAGSPRRILARHFTAGGYQRLRGRGVVRRSS